MLKGKNILVTGGAGFIGSHIVDKLLEIGAKVTVLDNLSTGSKENLSHCISRINFVEGDFCDSKCLDKVLIGIDAICHQAALRSVPKSLDRPVDFHDVNVTGNLNLFMKAREKSIKRIVCASSSSVYGNREDFPLRESDCPKPISPYAATKIMSEHYGYVFHLIYGVEVVSLRYFNVFGARQSLENKYAVVVPKFIMSTLHDEAAPIFGTGEQEREFNYVGNVVEANIAALGKEGIGGEAFNISGGSPCSVNNLLKEIQTVMGKKIAPKYLPYRQGDILRTEADLSKSKKLLGWQPNVNLRMGLKITVDWFIKNRKRYEN
jgi:nucleoside-diphosphate-sugar epimerase